MNFLVPTHTYILVEQRDFLRLYLDTQYNWFVDNIVHSYCYIDEPIDDAVLKLLANSLFMDSYDSYSKYIGLDT